MPGDRFYHSKKWERIRRAVLARDGYRCQVAARYGKNIEANTVHHIFPRDEYPQYQWQGWNLIAVSHEAHENMHERNGGALTEEGRRLMERTARKRGIDI